LFLVVEAERLKVVELRWCSDEQLLCLGELTMSSMPLLERVPLVTVEERRTSDPRKVRARSNRE
jgi:hypothetical protein